MDAITTDAQAKDVFDKADNLIGDVAGGMVGSMREPKVVAEASALMDAVLAYYRATDNAYGVARVMDSLGFKARHVDDDLDEAKARFQEAADMFLALERDEDRLAALIELGEMVPTHAEARRAAYDAIARGLPEPLNDEIDPSRLANAIALAGDADGALDLYQTMIQDALAKERKARAAILLRHVARVHEDQRRDKRAATETLEACLDCAEAAGDKAEIGAALLRLADIWSERGNKKTSQAYFNRAAGMRGLPRWQRDQIKVAKMLFG